MVWGLLQLFLIFRTKIDFPDTFTANRDDLLGYYYTKRRAEETTIKAIFYFFVHHGNLIIYR